MIAKFNLHNTEQLVIANHFHIIEDKFFCTCKRKYSVIPALIVEMSLECTIHWKNCLICNWGKQKVTSEFLQIKWFTFTAGLQYVCLSLQTNRLPSDLEFALHRTIAWTRKLKNLPIIWNRRKIITFLLKHQQGTKYLPPKEINKQDLVLLL